MARLHAGAWGGNYDCTACANKPSQMEVWGCEKKSILHEHYWPMIEDKEEVIQYSSCPFRYVPYNIILWMREYIYHKNFPASPMPQYSQINLKWNNAMLIYENEYVSALREKK